MKNIIKFILISVILSSCSGYKSTWDCPKVKGIGCSSLEYADEVARKQILLNTGKKLKKEVLIQQSDSHFEEAEIY
jgi:hypothetical protein